MTKKKVKMSNRKKKKVNNKKPLKTNKVILIGNGLNLACFNSEQINEFAWDKLIKRQLKKSNKIISDDSKVPLAYQSALADNKDNLFDNYPLVDNELIKCLLKEESNKVLLTTNYTFDIEYQCNKKFNSDIFAKQQKRKTIKMNNKYMLHTYVECNYNSHEKNVWHIHGDITNKTSPLLNFNEYIEYTKRIAEHVKNNYENKVYLKNIKNIKYESWIDYFFMCDVDIIGYGLDYLDIDIWWLIIQKMKNSPNKNLTYYQIKKDLDKDKEEFLIANNVKIITLDLNNEIYKKSYCNFINDINSI